jgi:hypothetical protein
MTQTTGLQISQLATLHRNQQKIDYLHSFILFTARLSPQKPLKSFELQRKKKEQYRHFQLLLVYLQNVFLPKLSTKGDFYGFCACKKCCM